MSVFKVIAGALPVLAALWIGAAGYGYALRRLCIHKPGRYFIEELAIGMVCLLLVNWIVAWGGWLSQTGAIAVFGAGALLNLLKFLPSKTGKSVERQTFTIPWSVVLLMPGLAMLLVAACCPPGTLWRVEAFGYDVTSYHLQLPREWLASSKMLGLEHNVYSFLPSLIEGGYLLIGVLSGSVVSAVYTCQLFHVSLGLLAAATIGKTVANRSNTTAGVGAAAMFLAVPWILITASMAYNEMGVLAFAAAAMLILFSNHGNTRSGAVLIGLLVGAATLCKLTAGAMFAIPIGLILLFNLNRSQSTTAEQQDAKRIHAVQLALIAAIVGSLTLSPYFIRNYSQTGNPIFPFAAETLGAGHWDEQLVQRWDTAHGLSPKHEGKPTALTRQWLLNTGYGAVGGRITPRETQNIARFDREGGVPILWIVVAVAAILCFINKSTRRLAAALLFMLTIQVGFWLFATHMQSRFLIPTLLPACLLAGLGYDRLTTLTKAKAPTIAPVIGSAVLIALIAVSYTTFASQTRTIPDPATGEPLQTPIWMAVDAPLDSADHPINRLPENSKVLLVADNSGLLYLKPTIVYASAFDEAPLGKFIREADGDPQVVNKLLRGQGITHIWVHWAELDRLHNTYGHDPDVTHATLNQLIATGWQPVDTVGQTATLYVLPR